MTESDYLFVIESLEQELERSKARKKKELAKLLPEFDPTICAIIDGHILGLESALSLLKICKGEE